MFHYFSLASYLLVENPNVLNKNILLIATYEQTKLNFIV